MVSFKEYIEAFSNSGNIFLNPSKDGSSLLVFVQINVRILCPVESFIPANLGNKSSEKPSAWPLLVPPFIMLPKLKIVPKSSWKCLLFFNCSHAGIKYLKLSSNLGIR